MSLFGTIVNNYVLDYDLDYNYGHTKDLFVHLTNVDSYKYEALY